ncbi:endonuclease/exonuclease/phosphatase family protein [Deinococcus sp. Marseille-Q6407]|uniref:endonuclease/exonuclease/phosphatase family protein n=1 Tax=Deinococcus sp. Marseille-Q6407 TaxID=2969223 RepID=UPI0021C00D6B|nr:endonuclease/exonuclease/phosphatase family protein [Deinococcus sp. Marseille-Q6407]
MWGLGEWPAERTVPTLLLAYLPPAVLLAFWPLLALGAAVQHTARWPVALALLAGLGYAGFTWHPARPAPPGSLTLLTYNIARGTQVSAGALAAQIQAQDADIVTLQETNGWDAGFTPELLRRLPGYHATQTGAGGELLTLSRLPVLSSREVHLPETSRRFLVTTLQTSQGPLNVVNVHFSTVMVSGVLKGQVAPTRDRRSAQLKILQRETAEMPRAVVAGDFNTPARGQVYRALTGQFTDAWEAAGQGFGYSFPARTPLLRIDHVLARGLQPVAAEVLPRGGSDHRGLRVVLRPQ